MMSRELRKKNLKEIQLGPSRAGENPTVGETRTNEASF